MPYYGLYIPNKNATASVTTTTSEQGNAKSLCSFDNKNEKKYVFDDKNEALGFLKLHKEARLREFNNKDDAIQYAVTGYEPIVQSKFDDPKPASTAATEKAAFRQPTKQELIMLRKFIESGNYDRVKSIIWDNPRYLVSSGDTPSTLKEGYRYNALHVCAIAEKPRIAELILKTVSDPNFVDLLMGKKNDLKMCKELCANLLDYYLNIPEKGRSETPLHLAAKFGSVEMVELLTSYPECRMVVNSDGLYPKDIICCRQPNISPEKHKKIATLLDERFYVPVLRSVDNAIPPEIGEPFHASNPPVLNSDPLSPEMKIQALAGPMSKEQATQFRKRWKTPPRMGSNMTSPIAKNPFISPRSNSPNKTPTKAFNGLESHSPNVKLRTRFNLSLHCSPFKKYTQAQSEMDIYAKAMREEYNNENSLPENGLTMEEGVKPPEMAGVTVTETNNNEKEQNEATNHSQHVPLCPSTPLIRMKKNIFFTYREPQDMNSPNVLDSPNVLNDSLGIDQFDHSDSPGYKERHVKISDTEKGLEVIGRELAKEQHIEWREYWDFLDTFIDIASPDGLQLLENHFAERVKRVETSKKTVKTMATATVALDDVCSALEKFGFSRDLQAQQITRNDLSQDNKAYDLNASASTTSATTPYTCVEKSLQVFAKRMTKTIIHNIENVVCINDTLLSELKRLKSLICSFKEDTRFLEVDFSKVHSRIANLISTYLQSSQEMAFSAKVKTLVVIRSLQTTPGERREHIECLCSRIYDKLANQKSNQILPESLKTEDLCSKAWFDERTCECQWDTNLSRKTSRRNRMEARYKIHQQNLRQEKAEKGVDVVDWRSNGNDSSDEDVFWSDFGESESDNDDIWFTPQGSPSRMESDDAAESDNYNIYVYGNEPTKRDLDVLNAIFHTEIDSGKFPNIHAWKTALLRFPNEEMDYFPSPSIVKKSHKFISHNMVNKSTPQKHNTPYDAKSTHTSMQNSQESQYKPQQQKLQLPTAKRLFNTPTRPKMCGTLINDSIGPPKTPFNKLRGLFSSYRETIENSPISSSPDCHSGDESKNLSLLNISAAE